MLKVAFWSIITMTCFLGQFFAAHHLKKAYDKLNEEKKNTLVPEGTKVSKAKIAIRRNLEDYNREIEGLMEKSGEEARKINQEMNAKGVLRSGATISAQLKRVRAFKKIGEMKEIELKRKLEDISIQLGKSNMSELWSFPELTEFKQIYEVAEATVRGAVSGMLREINKMARNLGMDGNYGEENL